MQIKSGSVLLIAFIFTCLNLAARPDGSQDRTDPFRGIEDERVLPMLMRLPRQHGGMNVPSVDGRFLYDLIIEKGYTRGLEIGTSNGYSALWIGLALKQNGGTLVTIEISSLAADEARENFQKAGLDDIIEVRTADALKEIPNIPGEFDFVFIDAWKPDYLKYLRLVKDRVLEGGAITAHSVISSQRQVTDFLDAIGNDPELKTTIHNISRDGISVSIVERTTPEDE